MDAAEQKSVAHTAAEAKPTYDRTHGVLPTAKPHHRRARMRTGGQPKSVKPAAN